MTVLEMSSSSPALMMTLVSLLLTDPSLLSLFSNSSFTPTLNLSLFWDIYLITMLLNSQRDESTRLCHETPTTQHPVSNIPLIHSPPASPASTPYTAAPASLLPQPMCVHWSPNNPTLWRLLVFAQPRRPCTYLFHYQNMTLLQSSAESPPRNHFLWLLPWNLILTCVTHYLSHNLGWIFLVYLSIFTSTRF